MSGARTNVYGDGVAQRRECRVEDTRGRKIVSSGSEPLEDGVRSQVGRQVTVGAYLMELSLAPPLALCQNLR